MQSFKLSKVTILPSILYLFVNSIFIFKYTQRIGLNEYLLLSLYTLALVLVYIVFLYLRDKKSIQFFKIAYWIIIILICSGIIFFLITVDRNTIRVDRWSALTYFWDYFFQGKYPYSTHTHFGLTNHPSPFPFWQFLNLPFYLLGDVGLGLIFFLVLTSIVVQKYFSSYKRSFYFFCLLLFSPAYWWEVMVRSDSLNNALLVFMLILWFEKSKRTLSNNFVLIAIICGLVATTRLTAILPLAIYFFRPYLNLKLKQKILFPALVLTVSFLIFSPFIFWDTNTWIFFSRNPFMNQADKGYFSILIFTMVIGVFMALRWKTIEQFFYYASLFIFIFIFCSQFGLFIRSDFNPEFISGSICDISYFNLFLPYCLASISGKIIS